MLSPWAILLPVKRAAAMFSRRPDRFGTNCPEVSAGNEVAQGKVETVHFPDQPVRDGREPKG